MIRSLYDLMGQNVNPPVDEATKAEHIHSVIQVDLFLKVKFFRLNSKNDFF